MKTSLKTINKEFKEILRIESIIGTKDITESDANFLKKRAESGSPRAMFDYGLFLLINKEIKEDAILWFNRHLKVCNGYGLWRASGIFAQLFDEYQDLDWYEWSIKCLRRSAWRQFKLAKKMLKDMKENPYSFPEA